MSQLTDQQIIQRHKAASLKILEAKANLWVTLSFVAVVGVIVGILLLIAAFFKLVLG